MTESRIPTLSDSELLDQFCEEFGTELCRLVGTPNIIARTILQRLEGRHQLLEQQNAAILKMSAYIEHEQVTKKDLYSTAVCIINALVPFQDNINVSVQHLAGKLYGVQPQPTDPPVPPPPAPTPEGGTRSEVGDQSGSSPSTGVPDQGSPVHSEAAGSEGEPQGAGPSS